MLKTNKALELYIHIPFCVKKCNYCDFLSAPCTREQTENYMAALFAEIAGRAQEYREYVVTSVFVGGGTPSIVDAKQMAALMELLKREFAVAEEAEITIEVNPGTADEEKLKCYYKAGINRLSIGLQSANDEELQMLGRIHSYEQFKKTYYAARVVGFANINVDVMSALPGQSLSSYQHTLYQLLQLTPMPEHISAYSLIVEEGTPFFEWQQEGTLNLPEEDCERRMYEETKRILGEAGFQRYEISNYARPGYECLHNVGYWKRTDYVGFGIGAASLIKNQRFCNDSDLEKYLEQPLACRMDFQELSIKEQMEETLFLGLRMTEGVSAVDFCKQYGKSLQEVYGDVIRRNIADGLLLFREACPDGADTGDREEKRRYLALTERGLDVSNYVMSQFLFDEE